MTYGWDDHMHQLRLNAIKAEEPAEVPKDYGDFLIVPSNHHPFCKVIHKEGLDLPKTLRGSFTTKKAAIAAVEAYLEETKTND